MRRFLPLAALALLAACGTKEVSYTAYVDPLIGSGGHGHVFVGANVPFGLVQLGPTSIPEEWDWTSGYHDGDSTVIGFSHTHLSGTGIGDLFDITVMPVTGQISNYARGNEKEPESGLWSYADRSSETVRPGYYSVPLERYGVRAELTATERVGLHRYTFPASDEAAVVFDLINGGCWDRATDVHLELCDPATGAAIEGIEGTAVHGWRHSSGWAEDQKLYFHAEFSKPVSLEYPAPGYCRANFRTAEGEQLLMKVALSPTGMDAALANLRAELPGWDFDATVKAADKKWNAELSKITVETPNEEDKKIFYTALYHTMIAPSLFCDANGDYRGADSTVHRDVDFTNYTTFSLWDTYRAAMPLMTIIQYGKFNDIINTMLHIYREQGKLPVWHLMGCETNCMVGNPGIPPVADAILKGFDGFDYELAYEAMVNSAMKADRGQDLRMQYGYIPCELFNESVANDMEYAVADGALAKVLKFLAENAGSEGDEARAEKYSADYQYFLERSHSYRNFFDPVLRFMRGKDSKGQFRKEYTPFASIHRADDYCEGNGWQYTWLAPHDFEGLVGCFGSTEAFIEKLDSLFILPSNIEGDETSPDISGLIGQYAHGNEPGHHILYFYTMASQPWKTAERVRQVFREMYAAEPDGLSGNEDVGQMSAWYVLSSLGFYQVEPAGGRYWFGTPLFDKASIKVSGGTFTVTAKDNSPENIYIQSMTLNGEPYVKGYIDYADIAAGGSLDIRMGPEPRLWY